ncbi:uncharacterized protein [Primulina huaijiensis]|uniref:uncharacterized protein n=1 Tax=Primulina huaijiensis TaxID=1492673 RepID=UPI003CC74A92
MYCSVHQKIRVFSCPEYSGLESGTAVDMDQESCGSSTEEVESPRSVMMMIAADGRNDRKSGGDKVRAHNQVLRIRAEDLHLGDDIGEGKLNKFGFRDFVIFSRPVLPASPLGGKTD